MIVKVKDIQKRIDAFDGNLDVVLEIVDEDNNLYIGKGFMFRFRITGANDSNQLIFRCDRGESTLHRYRWSQIINDSNEIC